VVNPLAGRDGGTSRDTSPAEPAAAGIRHATGQDLATPPRRPRCARHSCTPGRRPGPRT